MDKVWIVLPIGNHPFNKEYISQCAANLMTYEIAKNQLERTSKAYPDVSFVLFQSFVQITYKGVRGLELEIIF